MNRFGILDNEAAKEEILPMTHALIIDDNQHNIDVLIMLLENEGVGQTAVQSVKLVPAALAGLDSLDVIFLDLEFPQGSGMNLLHVLKDNASLDGVPIVAYTVHTSEINEARLAGFDSFLGKPLNTQRFPEQLRRILSGASVWDM
jgi:two-component system cell cycle response regulator DivK